jgi:hypothetical protein
MMSYLNVYANEVRRCKLFLETLTSFEELEGIDENTEKLREEWTAELQVWQFGYDELVKEMSE